MAKKIKYGKIELSDDEFNDENAMILISIRMPLTLLKDLKRMALTEKYSGMYQLLIRDILSKWIEVNSTQKKKRA